MIDSGKRVVIFMDYGADGSDGGVVDYFLQEFTMVSNIQHDWYQPLTVHRSGSRLMIARTTPSRVQSTVHRVH